MTVSTNSEESRAPKRTVPLRSEKRVVQVRHRSMRCALSGP